MANLTVRLAQLQNKYRVAVTKRDALDLELGARYGWERGWQRWLKRSDAAKRDRAAAAVARATDAIYTLLEASERDWKTGVPVAWVCGELPVDDAFRPRTEPLSVEPPRAYGY